MRRSILLCFIFCTTVLSAQNWVQVANLPSGRHHPVTFSLAGKGYAVTGTLANVSATDDFLEYDPATDSWKALADFPGPIRSFSIGATYNGLAYIGFGANTTQYLNDLWQWNPANGQWTQLSSCPCSGRRHPAFIISKGIIYVGLGDDISGNLKDWWKYTIDTDTWAQISDLPGPPRHHPFMFEAGGEVFAGMGHGGPVIYNDWYALDTTTNSWTPVTNFPGEARVAGTQFGKDGYGYVLSGDGDNHSWMPTGELWRYAPTTDSWLQLTPHPGNSRWAPGSFVIGDDVYFLGGYDRFTQDYPSDVWKFDLAANAVAINEQTLSNINIYPNPASNFISWNSEVPISKVVISNAVGQLVLTQRVLGTTADVSDLSNGLYWVQLYHNGALVNTEKLTINR